MIEPKSTDVGREVLVTSSIPRHERGTINDFDRSLVRVDFAGTSEFLERKDLEWADIAAAKDAIEKAGLEVEAVTDDTVKVKGCLYWPRTGMFERSDGTQGSGFEVAFVRYLKGFPPVPSMPPRQVVVPREVIEQLAAPAPAVEPGPETEPPTDPTTT